MFENEDDAADFLDQCCESLGFGKVQTDEIRGAMWIAITLLRLSGNRPYEQSLAAAVVGSIIPLSSHCGDILERSLIENETCSLARLIAEKNYPDHPSWALIPGLNRAVQTAINAGFIQQITVHRSSREEGDFSITTHRSDPATLIRAERRADHLNAVQLPSLGDDESGRFQESIANRSLAILQNAFPSSPRINWTTGRLCQVMEVTSKTINKYANIAGVRTPGRGEKNFEYPSDDARRILAKIAEKAHAGDRLKAESAIAKYFPNGI